jgi:tetratricopeptide (TPR) repeat protein
LTVLSVLAAAGASALTVVFLNKSRIETARASRAEDERDVALAEGSGLTGTSFRDGFMFPLQLEFRPDKLDSSQQSDVELWKAALEFHRQAARDRENHRSMEHGRLLLKLAKHYGESGMVLPALEYLREAIEIFNAIDPKSDLSVDDRFLIAETFLNAGKYSQESGDLATATRHLEQAKNHWETLVRDSPLTYSHQQGLAVTLTAQGAAFASARRYTEADAEYRKALEILTSLVSDNPRDSGRNSLAALHSNMAQIAAIAGRPSDSEQHLAKALEVSQSLAEENPQNVDYGLTVAATLNNFGRLYERTDRLDQARTSYEQAIESWLRLDSLDGGNPRYRSEAAKTYGNLASVLHRMMKYQESADAYEKKLSTCERLAGQFADQAEVQSQLASAYSDAADFYSEPHPLRNLATAESFYQAAIRIASSLVEKHPGVDGYQYTLAMIHNNLGVLNASQGRRDAAVEQLESAIAIREDLAKDHPNVTEYRIALGENYFNRGLFSAKQESPDQMLAWFSRAITEFETVLRKEPRHPEARVKLKKVFESRAQRLKKLDRDSEAQENLRRARELE